MVHHVLHQCAFESMKLLFTRKIVVVFLSDFGIFRPFVTTQICTRNVCVCVESSNE